MYVFGGLLMTVRAVLKAGNHHSNLAVQDNNRGPRPRPILSRLRSVAAARWCAAEWQGRHHDRCLLWVVRAGWAGAEAGRAAGADELAEQRIVDAGAAFAARRAVGAGPLDVGRFGGELATGCGVAEETVPRRGGLREQAPGGQVAVGGVAEEAIVAEHVAVDPVAVRGEQAQARGELDAALAV
jgi:hypothetical protein